MQSLSDEELKRRLAILAEAGRSNLEANPLRVIQHPLYGVIPLRPFHKQQEFLDRFAAVQRVMGWDGPNRPGKSMAATMVVVATLTGWPIETWPSLPWNLRGRPLGPPKRVGCITISKEKSRDGQQRYIAERLPKHLLACKPWSEKTGFGNPPKLVLVNGSTVNFLSDMQREQSLEAFQWDLAWIDEAVDEWVYRRVVARLTDVGGKLIITAVGEKAWIHRVLRQRLLSPEAVEPAPSNFVDTISDSTIFDNELIDRRDIDASIVQWGGQSSREARMRAFGEYVALEGLVFDTYLDAPPHIEDRYEPPDDWTRYEGADPGYRNPYAVGFYAVDPAGRIHVYDEIYVRGKTREEVGRLILERRALHGYRRPHRPCAIGADADATSFRGVKMESDRMILARMGIETVAAAMSPGSVAAGNGTIRSLWAQNRLVVQAQCVWHRFELNNYRYDDPDEHTGEFLGDRENPVDANNHAISGLRYALEQGMPYVPTLVEAPPETPLGEYQREAAAARDAADDLFG